MGRVVGGQSGIGHLTRLTGVTGGRGRTDRY